MSGLIADLPSLTVVAAILFAIFVESRREVARSQRRQRELGTALALLNQHRESLMEFVTSEHAPDDLRTQLLVFSDVVGDRTQSELIARRICEPDQPVSAEERAAGRTLRKRLDALRSDYPELSDAFVASVSSGLGAMLFRHPETAHTFRLFVSRTMMDARKEATLFARVVHQERTRSEAPGMLASGATI